MLLPVLEKFPIMSVISFDDDPSYNKTVIGRELYRMGNILKMMYRCNN